MKRELSDEEKAMCCKAIDKFTEEVEYQKYLGQHASLMLSTGLEQNLLLQMSEFRIKKREANSRLMELQQQIFVLKDQIVSGVEAKEEDSGASPNKE